MTLDNRTGWNADVESHGCSHHCGTRKALSEHCAFLALLYRYSLRRPGRLRRVWPGASVATLLAAAASVGLGFYATNIARYALFYGGLAAIVILLLWLWLWSTAILFGAELNIALEDVKHARKVFAEDQAKDGLGV